MVDNKKGAQIVRAPEKSEGEKNTGKVKEFSRLNCINYTNSKKFKLPPIEKEVICLMWHKMETFAHNHGWFYWTYDQIQDDLNIDRRVFNTIYSRLNEMGLIEKDKRSKVTKGYKTKVNYYRLNLNCFTNPEILQKIFKPNFISEYQSEFGQLAQKIGYYDYKELDVIEDENQKYFSVIEFYKNEITNYQDNHFLPLYVEFFKYITSAKNPFKKPLKEITSLPGQPTLPELNEIFKLASEREVKFYYAFNKFVEWLSDGRKKKISSFTVRLANWVEREKVNKNLNRVMDNWIERDDGELYYQIYGRKSILSL